jgi:HD-like signal output (HDOD) protein
MAFTRSLEDGTSPLEGLRLRLAEDLRDRLIDQAVSMPLGNQPALARVADLCRSETASPAEVASEAALDEGFTATLLRMVNSAALGTHSHVDELPVAITRLGFKFVECLATAAPGLRLLTAPSDGLEGARKRLHEHSVRTGVLARMLAPENASPDRALTAGLVHNVGLAVLSIHARSGFQKLSDAAQAGEQLPIVEQRLFGFTHGELGSLLGSEWSYPETLVSVVREHSSPHPSTPLAAVVQVADLLARDHGFGIEPVQAVSAEVAETAGIDLERARWLAAGLFQDEAKNDRAAEVELGFESSLIDALGGLV